MPRVARSTLPVAGMGGHLQVRRNDGPALGSADTAYDGVIFEVERWALRRRFLWAPNTHSGSNGALTRVLVAQDFDFVCRLAWNAHEDLARNDVEDNARISFVEQIWLGKPVVGYNVEVLFALGDALHYSDADALPLGFTGLDRRGALFCEAVALEEAEWVTDSKGRTDEEGIVRANIRGIGNALLMSLRGREVLFNSQDDPATPAPPPVP